jgi:hypothetical protein
MTLKPASLPDADVNHPYLVFLEAGGAPAPYTFTLMDGALPPGLSLAVDGSISGGRGEKAGEYKFIVLITAADGERGAAKLALTVVDPAEVPSDIPTVALGDPSPAPKRKPADKGEGK